MMEEEQLSAHAAEDVTQPVVLERPWTSSTEVTDDGLVVEVVTHVGIASVGPKHT